MRTICQFTVPGQPVPWARARVGGGARAKGAAKQAAFFTAPAQARHKAVCKSYAAADMLQRRIRGEHDGRAVALGLPIIFEARVFLSIPSSFNKADEAAAAAGLLLPAVKPDLDNWLKLPMDALEDIAYAGDGQVVGFGGSGKWYSRKPRTEIHVYHAPSPGDLAAIEEARPRLPATGLPIGGMMSAAIRMMEEKTW